MRAQEPESGDQAVSAVEALGTRARDPGTVSRGGWARLAGRMGRERREWDWADVERVSLLDAWWGHDSWPG